MRAPYIPEAAMKKKIFGISNANIERNVAMRKLEREIELEMQDEYILDLKSKFLVTHFWHLQKPLLNLQTIGHSFAMC